MAAVAVAALMSAILSPRREGAPPSDPATANAGLSAPEESVALSRPVEDAYEAARSGKLEDYMAQFADPLRAQLIRLRAQKGDGYLRDYLAQLTRPIKGLAADLTRKEEVGPGEIRLPVQFTYSDRNEAQFFFLRRSDGQWRITHIETVRSAPVLIPYGTPIGEVK